MADTGPSRAAPLDAPSRTVENNSGPRVQQPKPQSLPSRNQGSAILVNPRQKGNPVITNIRGVPWEWADTPADYVLGATTCALFLSLKYHRLHPEYIYTRMRDIKGMFNLRIILTMVDIENHEDSLKELAKTSLINEVTLILCWSAQEAGHYLELFKSYEHAAPTIIKAHQSESYSDRLVEFITVPRSVNKTDAISLVSAFGSLRTAVNAEPEEISLVPGFGGKKVQRWCSSVSDPFRVKKADRRGINRNDSRATKSLSRDASRANPADEQSFVPSLIKKSSSMVVGIERSADNQAAHGTGPSIALDRMAILNRDQPPESATNRSEPAKPKEPQLNEGIAAALAKLRDQ